MQIMNNVPRGAQNSRLGNLVSAMVKLATPRYPVCAPGGKTEPVASVNTAVSPFMILP